MYICKKIKMLIDKKLHLEIKEYCKLNNLKMGEFINELLRKAFNIEKYGISPFYPVESKVKEEEIIASSMIEKEEEIKFEENKTIISKKRKLS